MHALLRAKANTLLLVDLNGRIALAEVFCASGLLYGHVLALCEATCRRLPTWPWVVIWAMIWAVFGAIALVAFNCTLAEKVAREEAAMEKAAMEDVIEEVVDESKRLDLGLPALEVAGYRDGLGSDEVSWTSVKTRSKKSTKKKAGRAAVAAAPARPPCDRPRQWVQQEAECEARREAALEAARLEAVLAAALVRSSRAAAQTARAAAAFKAREVAAVAAATAVAAVAAATAAEAEAIALERAMVDGGKGVGEGGSSGAVGPSKASEVAVPDQYTCSITAEIMINPVSTVRAPPSPTLRPVLHTCTTYPLPSEATLSHRIRQPAAHFINPPHTRSR